MRMERRGYSDRDRNVSLRLTFTHYREHLAPKWAEHDPSLRVYLSSHFDREPVEFKLDPSDDAGTYNVEISGQLKDETLSTMAAIGLKGYVTSETSAGIPCRVSAGSDFINLQEIIEHLDHYSVYEKEIELRMHSVKNFPKGKIHVSIERDGLRVGDGIRFRPLEGVEGCFVNGEYDADAGGKRLLQYIGSSIKAKDKLQERDHRTTRIRVPAYLGDPGMELTNGVPLPAGAFVMYEVPKSNARFWVNTVGVVMAREGWSLDEWRHLKRAEQCEVFKAAVCYVAQYMPYIGDTVDMNDRRSRYRKALKQGCENFEGGYERGSGDCEDLEQAIMATVDSLREARLSGDVPTAVRGVQKLSYQYMAAMSLDSVTSAAVTGANDKVKALGAHMNLNLLPTSYFKECVDRVAPEISKELPWEGLRMDDGENVVKVAEGTGMYYSKEHVEASREVMQYLYHETCFDTFKKPIFHKQGTHSPFYRKSLTLFVPEFARLGSNYIGFWYCDDEGYRGASFEDLERRSDKVGILPQPRIPDDVMALSREAVKIRSPPFHLEISEPLTAKTFAQADRIVEAVAELDRQPAYHYPPAVVYTNVDLLTEGRADDVIRTLSRKSGVWKVQYNLEQVCDSMPVGIRFEIFADPGRERAYAINRKRM